MTANTQKSNSTPAPYFNQFDIPVTPIKASTWYRLHHENFPPVYFTKEGRFSPPTGNYSVLYLGSDIKTCLLEIFGDEIYEAQNAKRTPCLSLSIWRTRYLSKITLPELRICDLSKQNVITACGVDLCSIMSTNFAVPHAWASAIMTHPQNFDAIKYTSRFTRSACLALFNKSALLQQITSIPLGSLNGSQIGENLLNSFSIALV